MNSIFNLLEKQKVMCNLDSLIDDIILLHNKYLLQIKNTLKIITEKLNMVLTMITFFNLNFSKL